MKALTGAAAAVQLREIVCRQNKKSLTLRRIMSTPRRRVGRFPATTRIGGILTRGEILLVEERTLTAAADPLLGALGEVCTTGSRRISRTLGTWVSCGRMRKMGLNS